jgi:hypothetical protein
VKTLVENIQAEGRYFFDSSAMVGQWVGQAERKILGDSS